MLISIGTEGSREKNIVSGTMPAQNSNPTITSTTFSARSRFMVPPIRAANYSMVAERLLQLRSLIVLDAELPIHNAVLQNRQRP
jgi:hypothetical protein